MKEEFDLSKKIVKRAIKTKETENIFENIDYNRVILVKDVKEFIRLLKEVCNHEKILKELKRELVFSNKEEKQLEGELFDITEIINIIEIIRKKIDKLAGEKLI